MSGMNDWRVFEATSWPQPWWRRLLDRVFGVRYTAPRVSRETVERLNEQARRVLEGSGPTKFGWRSK